MCIKRGGNGAILAKNLLSSSALKAANWEITIKSWPGFPIFSMGYVEHDKTQSVKFGSHPWIGDGEGQRSLSIDYSRSVFAKGNNGMYEQYEKKWDQRKVKQGDQFEIQFDFIEQKSRCYWNGNCIGILDDKLSDEVYPAITLVGYHEFECTKWELLYIKH